jgi:hypothetical protein
VKHTVGVATILRVTLFLTKMDSKVYSCEKYLVYFWKQAQNEVFLRLFAHQEGPKVLWRIWNVKQAKMQTEKVQQPMLKDMESKILWHRFWTILTKYSRVPLTASRITERFINHPFFCSDIESSCDSITGHFGRIASRAVIEEVDYRIMN